MTKIRNLALVGIILAIVVVALGAYTRLTHAGLGCPDWPGCYGFLDVPQTEHKIAIAEQAFPDRPVEPEKAWNEMIHRYFAGSLGLLILAISFLAWRNREQGGPLKQPFFMLALVTFQAALGMWTVTMMLMPVVVMSHLLGGFATLCLLYLLYLRTSQFRIPGGDSKLKRYIPWAIVGMIILFVQISLGGWTSANYAALVCVELPVCQAGWQNEMVIGNAFELIPPQLETYEFGHLSHAERVTIHVAHRFGAIVTACYLAWLGFSIWRQAQSGFMKNVGVAILTVLTVQVGLGVSNIVFSLPLSVAVAHNVVAAILMMTLITLTYSLKRKI